MTFHQLPLSFTPPVHRVEAGAGPPNAGLDADTALSFPPVDLVDAVYRALGV